MEEKEISTLTTGFKPRWYQSNLLRAVFKEKKKKAILVWSRRAGKDVVAFNIAIFQCMAKRCTVFYIFPNQPQARAAIWQGITIEGKPFLSYIPEHLIASKNEARMEIKFTNGSILALKGSTNYDSLRGSNPYMCIFSEYAYQDANVYRMFLQPVLAASNGIAIFISTPQGKNHFYELFEIAKNTPEDWYVDFLTAQDTQHIDMNEVYRDVQLGIISQDHMEQEFLCSFSRGVSGSLFGRQLNKLILDERVGFVPYESGHPVHVSMDLGWDDDNCLIFFQVIGQAVRIIDTYSNRLKDIEHYVHVMQERNYIYGKVFLPHDAEQHSLETGNTRTEKFLALGCNVEVLKRKPVPDRIEDGRCIFARLWIDEKKSQALLKALENYRREWDDKLERYKEAPVHDKWSHFADAFTYMADAVQFVQGGMTQQDADRIRARALEKHNSWGY